jgi:dipeptidyl aminopeptidase/acylaminoacyl peptidase
MSSFEPYGPFAISPDGRNVAYVLTDPKRRHRLSGMPISVDAGDLWMLDVGDGKVRNLTEGAGANSKPQWSTDGRFLAFCKEVTEKDLHHFTLWLWEKESAKLSQIGNLDSCFASFKWTPDNRHILVQMPSVNDKTSADNHDENDPTASNKRTRKSESDANSHEEDRIDGKPTVEIYRASKSEQGRPKPTDSGNPWSIDYFYDLVNIEVPSGTIRRVLKRERIGSFRVSPDGSSIAVALTKRFEKTGSQQLLYDIAIYDISTLKGKVIAEDVQLGPTPYTFSWSPDSTLICYRTVGALAKGDVYVASVKTAGVRKLTDSSQAHFSKLGYQSGIQRPLWGRDGRSIYFAADRKVWRASTENGQLVPLADFPGKQIELIEEGDGQVCTMADGSSMILISRDESTQQRGFHLVNLETGDTSKLFEGDFDFGDFGDALYSVSAPANGNAIFYMAEAASQGVDLWMIGKSRTPRRLTAINPNLEKYHMGKSLLIDWYSLDGARMHGALLLPANYEAGKRYPLIVGVYGTTSSLSKRVNQFGLSGCSTVVNGQLLSTRQYAVLCADSLQKEGTPMLDLAKSVLPAVNKVVEMGIADSEKMGVMGQSYGGYSTLSVIVQTKRFKAAVMSDGTGDLIGEYGEMGKDGSAFGVSLLEQGQGLMGGTPWEFRDRYIENSPMFYLDRVETPLLIIHGAEDSSVASFLGDQVFVGMRRLGKEVEYAKYQGEGHSALYWTYANQMDCIKRVIEWFDRYLKEGNAVH